MKTELNSVAKLFLAGPKGYPYRGWAAKIVSWEPNSRPDLKFGSWEQSSSYKKPGGTVVLGGVAPGEIVLFGANSPAMRSKDKGTYFGRVMRVDDGSLTIRRLVDGTLDARQEWLKPPLVEVPSQIASMASKLLAEVSIRGTVNELQCIFDAITAVLRARYFSSMNLSVSEHDYMSVGDNLRDRLRVISTISQDIEPFSRGYEAWLENWLIQRAARPKRIKDVAAGTPQGELKDGVWPASHPRLRISSNSPLLGDQFQNFDIQKSSKFLKFVLSADSFVM